MTRSGRWQDYLFWTFIAGSLLSLGVVGVDLYQDRESHLAPFLVADVLLIALVSALYVARSRTAGLVHQSEARYRLMMDEASDPIFVSNLVTRELVSANRRALELTGYSADELARLHVPDVVDFGTRDEDEDRHVVAEGALLRLNVNLIHKDGHEIPVEGSVSRVSEDLVQAIVRPIGERLKEEEALRRSESIFRAVSEMTSDYVYSMKVHPDGSLSPEWLTGAYERVTGYTIEEAKERGGWQDLVHPDDVEPMREVLVNSLQEGGSAESEFRIVTKSGETRFLRSWARFERDDPDGPVVRIVGAVSDVTERKSLEEHLGESERRFTELYERIPIGIYRRAWDGPGLDANPTCIEMFGYPDEKTYLEQDPRNYYADPKERDRWVAAIQGSGVVINFEVEYKRYDGSTFWGRNTARLIRDAATGAAWIEGAIVDITEEKNLDEELRATLRDLRRADAERKRLLTHLVRAKEEERSRVASDIHDDSVQIMTAIAIDLERLSRKMPEPEHRTVLEQLEERARDAVGRLRTMVFELRPPALDQEGVVAALRMYLEEFTIDTGIDYEFQSGLDEEPSNPIRVVLYRIAQEALTNVRKHSDASRVVVGLHRSDRGIAMTITDDGRGFDLGAEELNSPGHIGLSEMRERAEIGGGRFDVKSAPGGGTSVAVWVPELSG